MVMILKSLVKSSIYFFAFAILFLGCAKQELEVSYIYLPAFEVLPSSSTGDISTQITDVRVVLGPESLGFYPLPATIPILGSGEMRLRLEPVVRVAGIASNRIVYPFYEVFEETRMFVPGRVDTIIPQLNYDPSVTFAYVEDFEGNTPSLPLDLDGFPNTNFVPSTLLPRSGAQSGRATLMGDTAIVEAATAVLNVAGQTWNRIWMEMDYRGDVPLGVAMLPEEIEATEVRITRYVQGAQQCSACTREDWVKLYFELVDNGLRDFATRPFRIGFLAANDSARTADVFIDNVKIIYQD